jgi:hypothetical protein
MSLCAYVVNFIHHMKRLTGFTNTEDNGNAQR